MLGGGSLAVATSTNPTQVHVVAEGFLIRVSLVGRETSRPRPVHMITGARIAEEFPHEY